MSTESVYVQLMWEDPVTGELQQPLLAPPIAIGRDISQMPEHLGEQSVSRLELNHQQISRFHALITVANHRLYITDQSTNGTFLNGRPIRQGIQPLSSKDTLRIGPYKITAALRRERDLDATEQNRDQAQLTQFPRSDQKNALIVWLIGAGVLVFMGIGAWVLVSALLERSRPRVPASPSPTSSVPLLDSHVLLFVEKRLYQFQKRIQHIGDPNREQGLGRVFKLFDPPQPELKRGENSVKVPLFKEDLGGSPLISTKPIKFENTP